MTKAVEYFKWWIKDETTGQRRLTIYKLSRADAQRAFPGSVPELESREVRLPVSDGRSGWTPVRAEGRVKVFAFEVFSLRSTSYVRAVSKGTREAIAGVAGSRLVEDTWEWVSDSELERGFLHRTA